MTKEVNVYIVSCLWMNNRAAASCSHSLSPGGCWSLRYSSCGQNEDHLIFRNDVNNPERIISSPFVPLDEYMDSSTSDANDKPYTVQQMTNLATHSPNLLFLWHSYVQHRNESRKTDPQLRKLGPVHVPITYILNSYFNIILSSVSLHFLSDLPLICFQSKL